MENKKSVKAYSGNHAVFASGMLFSFSKHDDFRLEITPDQDFTFNVYIKIIENGGTRDVQKVVQGKDIHITCINFGLGAGTTYPLMITPAGNKNMYMHLWLESVDSSSNVYKVNYTIYTEE
ncbi:MAG: hypothetical protein IJS39_11600 [Synergistaceae bacterium]|nr:hypothetical protein [Synergistaceae bacterium]